MEQGRRELARAVVDAVRQTAVHYGLWFANAVQQCGIDRALEMEREAGDKAAAIIVERLCATLAVKVDDGLPAPLAAMDEAFLEKLLAALAVNWLAVDGVWFQAVEHRDGMAAAKAVNDACWACFAPLEAALIKALHALGEGGGLAALAKALTHRLYDSINDQEIVFEGEQSLVLRMKNCRVQAARRRKGLPDYPCKSAGLVEFEGFARTVDRRIHCECIGCPPDPHPADWFCAWRFRLADEP